MRLGGILVILLFLLVGCASQATTVPDWVLPSERIFSDQTDPILILTDQSPSQILKRVLEHNSTIRVDFQAPNALFLTIFGQVDQRLTMVENDLDGPERYLIMITNQ